MTEVRNEYHPGGLLSNEQDFTQAKNLEEALQRVRQIVLDGLGHGFFRCEISAEIGKNNNRELIVQSGKSHKFIIPLKELNR